MRQPKLFVSCLLLAGGLLACAVPPPPSWSWQRAERGLPRQLLAMAVAANPAAPDQIWAGVYAPAGLISTTNGGHTWTSGAAGLGDNPVFALLNRGDHLWAAARDGLFTSADGGATWQPVGGGLPAATVFSLAADAPGRIYAGTDDAGVFSSADGLTGWQSLSRRDSRLNSAGVLALAVSADGQYLYAGTAGRGVFASRDGGLTWQQTYAGEYAPNIALNPRQPAVAVASLRHRLVRTVDGGQSWHTLKLDWAAHEVVALLWLADGTLGAGTSQGELYRSRDGGATWQPGGVGLPAAGVLSLSEAGWPNGLLAGTWQGLFGSRDGGQTWQNLAAELGATDPQALLSHNAGVLLGTRTGIYRWDVAGEMWQPTAGQTPSGAMTLLADPLNPDTLYAGTSSHGLYRSRNGGDSWEPLATVVKGIPAVAVSPVKPGYIYYLAEWERVYQSRDRGQSWSAHWTGLGEVIETTSLAADPIEPVIYVGTESGLYLSRNDEPWDVTAWPLVHQSILMLAAQPPGGMSGSGVLYIGSTRGVARTDNQGQTIQGGNWGRGLENVSVTALLVSPRAARQLVVGTAYHGVYESLDGGYNWRPIGPADMTAGVVESLAWGPGGQLFVASSAGVWRGQAVNLAPTISGHR